MLLPGVAASACKAAKGGGSCADPRRPDLHPAAGTLAPTGDRISAMSFNHAIVGFAIPVVAASVCKTAEGSEGSCACSSMRVSIYTGWDVLGTPTA